MSFKLGSRFGYYKTFFFASLHLRGLIHSRSLPYCICQLGNTKADLRISHPDQDSAHSIQTVTQASKVADCFSLRYGDNVIMKCALTMARKHVFLTPDPHTD